MGHDISQEYRFISTDTLLPVELQLPADEQARIIHEAMLKEQRDNYARAQGAKINAMLTVAKNLLNAGDSINKIVSVTGLTHEEVEGLQNTN